MSLVNKVKYPDFFHYRLHLHDSYDRLKQVFDEDFLRQGFIDLSEYSQDELQYLSDQLERNGISYDIEPITKDLPED